MIQNYRRTSPDQKKVLIVEDEIALLHLLAEQLNKQGLFVFEAKNGLEGLRTALETKPDLILLDLAMPEMNGIEMLKKLRQDPWGKGAKVLVLSNFSDNDKIAEVLEQGSFEYILKSDWNLERLLTKVNQVLEKKYD
jgi:DNA-binding response OmpR family regulator